VRRVNPSRVTVVVLLALFGLVLAAAVTYTASRIVSQPIGLAAEPTDIGESLGPRPRPATGQAPRVITRTTTVEVTPQPTTTATTTPPATTFTPSTTPSGPATSGGEGGEGGERPGTPEPSPGSPGYTGRGDGDD